MSFAEVSLEEMEKPKTDFNPFPLYGVLRNEMTSRNLTFIINCVRRDYFRYEFAIQMVLKTIRIPYRIVHMDNVDFKHFIAEFILHRLTTSGEQWFDIFMLCWDDGRNSSPDSGRQRPIDQLVEIFREKNHEMGNVRWLFFTWEAIMKSIQRMCGVIYVDLKQRPAKIFSESIDEIRKCGGRMVFLDYKGGQEHLLRNPTIVNASIFEHEIEFQRLGYLTVLCEFSSPARKYFCGEQPQREIFDALSRKVNISLRKSDARHFGRCIDDDSDNIFLRGKCSGLLSDMQKRLFDLCAVNIYPTQNISMALDLVSSYYRFDQLTFFAPPAQRIIGSFRSILLPFQDNVWLSIALTMIVTSIFLSFMTKRAFDAFGLLNHLFYVSMIATGRVPTIPDRFYQVTYIAVLLAAALLANTLLSHFYAAVLTSFRQHPPTTPVIDTLTSLEKILKNEPSAVNVAVLNDTKYNAILNPREPTDLMKLIRNHTTFCETKSECVELVLERKHVLLATDYNLKTEIGTNPHTQAISRARDNIFAGRYSLPVQKGSPISKQVMKLNGKLFEGGIFQRINEKENYEIKPRFEKEKPLPPNSKLTLKDLKGLMILYAGTSLMSLISFVCEKIVHGALRDCRARDRRIASLSSPWKPPEKSPCDDYGKVPNGIQYHSTAGYSSTSVRKEETVCRKHKARSRRILLLCDKDGNPLDPI
ncbi:uncharacterized protein LOC114828004 [Galendromus occidentalis]|uniref:Uncharacterized protein LOC114828004 n=1 Tax=Galendromus occidentalis TaxID=34638 RepID=A0AAJ7WHN7_9ACAR|nr:uncharacterized protein LOC114828004 [Galendromus occidentalis]